MNKSLTRLIQFNPIGFNRSFSSKSFKKTLNENINAIYATGNYLIRDDPIHSFLDRYASKLPIYSKYKKDRNTVIKDHCIEILKNNQFNTHTMELFKNIHQGKISNVRELIALDACTQLEKSQAQMISNNMCKLEDTHFVLIPAGKTMIWAGVIFLSSKGLILFPIKWLYEYLILDRRGCENRREIKELVNKHFS